ncbi:MAG: class I SAM-dependent methyltransferase [Candidatus Eiseniibacteriota bacterium]
MTERAPDRDGWVRRPDPGPDGIRVFLREITAELGPGSRVLDAGCGPGSWDYSTTPDLRIVGFDVLPIHPPVPHPPNASYFRGDLAQLAVRDRSFDAVLVHYVLEHVTELERSADTCARVIKPGGLLYVSVPRSAAFDDRFYRFAGYFAKYALLKFRKRIEHQQRFDFASLLALFYARGFALEGFSLVPAGFSWLNDTRTKKLQGPFVSVLGTIKRLTGLDLFRDANFVCRFRHTGKIGVRHVTHVCRECGEQSVLTPPAGAPDTWMCPFCGKPNGLYLAPSERHSRRERTT